MKRRNPTCEHSGHCWCGATAFLPQAEKAVIELARRCGRCGHIETRSFKLTDHDGIFEFLTEKGEHNGC